MTNHTSILYCACLLLLLPRGAYVAQEARLAPQAIPGLHGATLAALADFPWAPVSCDGPTYAALDAAVLHVGSPDTTLLDSADLAVLSSSPYHWHLAPFRSMLRRTPDTVTLKAVNLPASHWPAPVDVPDPRPGRAAARERWNMAVANGDTLAILFISFDGCWSQGSEGSDVGVGAIGLRRSSSRWEIMFIDVGQP